MSPQPPDPSAPPAAVPASGRHRPVPLSALVLATGAVLSAALFTWIDLGMAEADDVPVDAAPLIVLGSVLGMALVCLLGAAVIGRGPTADRRALHRNLLRTSMGAAGLLTVGMLTVILNVLVAIAADLIIG